MLGIRLGRDPLPAQPHDFRDDVDARKPRPRRRVDFGIARHRLLAHVLPGRQRKPPVLQRGRGPLAAVRDPFTSTPRPSQVSPSISPTRRRSLAGSWISFCAFRKIVPTMPESRGSLSRIAEYRRFNSSPCRSRNRANGNRVPPPLIRPTATSRARSSSILRNKRSARYRPGTARLGRATHGRSPKPLDER